MISWAWWIRMQKYSWCSQLCDFWQALGLVQKSDTNHLYQSGRPKIITRLFGNTFDWLIVLMCVQVLGLPNRCNTKPLILSNQEDSLRISHNLFFIQHVVVFWRTEQAPSRAQAIPTSTHMEWIVCGRLECLQDYRYVCHSTRSALSIQKPVPGIMYR